MNKTLDEEGLELSTRILARTALERGIAVEVLDRADQFIRLRGKGKVEYVKQATRTSADCYISPLIMENKEVTKLVLRENGIRVPDGMTVYSEEEAGEAYPSYAGRAVVIKPKSTNFGLGVTMIRSLRSREEYDRAVRFAFEHDRAVMIEEFLEGREYRFLVIGEETAAVLYRVPANVKGDGRRTVAQLVAEKNKDPLRGTGYVTPLERIRLGDVEQAYLQAQGKSFQTVLAEGEIVYLRENSNISTGGDSIDATDEMPDAYKRIAVEAAKAVGARICGADIVIRDLEQGPESPGNYGIIELNFNPALHIHNFPYRGLNRRVEAKVLDLLEL